MRFFILSAIFLFITTLGYCQQNNFPRPKIGLVLSGGGAKGLAHIGVIKVLEEAGIPVDYIGGTSMGSIIGGLYAIGYSPKELHDFTVQMDWDSLLTDRTGRQNLSFEEKEENARYFVSFPFKERKIGLPSGAISGQNIYALFNKMASPVFRERDFTKFPIPFLCVATDIENARATVLKSGYLPQAMRASMAIPSIFTPEVIDGNIYVDGGVLNNFPVLEVKDMGADILIGVDVGFHSQPRKALNTIPGILHQSMYTLSKTELDKNRKACDILIEPDVDKYMFMNYNEADSIIARGEKAARAMLPRLKKLADSLNQFQPLPAKTNDFKRLQSIYVKEIEITGLKLVPKEFILRKLQIAIPSELSFEDLESKIALAYGTQFFDKITYRLEPMDDGAKIILEIAEKSTNYFKVGIHYDSDFKTALLLNTTFRNIPAAGSKFSMDLALGENIVFNSLLYFNTGWNPERIKSDKNQNLPDFGIRLNSRKMEMFEYQEEHTTASYDLFDANVDLFWQWNLSNSTALGGGITGDYARFSNRVGEASIPVSDYFYANFHLYYKIDSYDESFYPHRGVQFTAQIYDYNGLEDHFHKDKNFFQGSLRFSHAVSAGKKVTFTNFLFMGYSGNDIIPAQYRFYLGGLGGPYFRGMVPLTGPKYMQLTGSNAWAAGSEIRLEAWQNNFISLKANIAKASNAGKNLFNSSGINIGTGVSYGYRSVIGPMEVTLMTSSSIKGVAGFINIGYWF